MASKLELSKAFLHKVNDHLICLLYKSDFNFDIEDAIETNSAIYKLAEGKPYIILVDTRGVYGNITNAARKHFVSDEKTKHLKIAGAILIDNLPARILARFYINVNKPHNPVKIFSKKNEAIAWLEKIYSTNPLTTET